MSFDWLRNFQQKKEKPRDYAEKTLAAYRLGMRANGSIVGVSITTDPDGCSASKALEPDAIYHPDDAPHVPLASCDRKQTCACVYRPIMSYQVEDQQ